MNAQDHEPTDEEKVAQHSEGMPAPPDEYANPPGIGGGACDVADVAVEAEPCDPAEAEDLVLEESKPGAGIYGYEGEEVGGG